MKAGKQPKTLERGMVLVAPGQLAGEKLRFVGSDPGGYDFERTRDGAPTRIVGRPWPWPGWVLAEDWPCQR